MFVCACVVYLSLKTFVGKILCIHEESTVFTSRDFLGEGGTKGGVAAQTTFFFYIGKGKGFGQTANRCYVMRLHVSKLNIK